MIVCSLNLNKEHAMAATIVVGAQWGDEGKGKVVDLLAKQATRVIRFQGGNNAGHTLIFNGEKLILHLTPSGIMQEETTCYVGPGVVMDPDVLMSEVLKLEDLGVIINGRLKISARTTLIMPYHKLLDKLREEQLKGGKIGTTGRGIGPAYQDLTGRTNVKVSDLFLPADQLRALIQQLLLEKNALIKFYTGDDSACFDAEPLVMKLMEFGEFLLAKNMVQYNLAMELINADYAGENLLFEGAQGTYLDNIQGTCPFITSSITLASAAAAYTGFPMSRIREVFGVAKLYVTRVGNGPFPTEMKEKDAESIRERGGEFGSTTGRARRIGWPDWPLLRLAAMMNGLTCFIITKADVLTGKDLLYCDQYELPAGPPIQVFPQDGLCDCRPILEPLPFSWQSHEHARGMFTDPGAQKLHRFLSAKLPVPVAGYSVGPGRDDFFWVQP